MINYKIKSSVMIIFLIIFSLFIINLSSAESCSLSVSLVNQDPNPATPGEYVNVVFQISGLENPNCEGAIFELIPDYPFSLDTNETKFELSGSTWISNYKSEWMIPYKLRIAKDAYDGNYDLKVKYGQTEKSLGYKYFNISIEDSRTNFDAVIQDSSESSVSLAIANTGKYTANSVVVRIPDQTNFKVSGSDGQMVGNLDSGDYTIVSFTLNQITTIIQTRPGQTQTNSTSNEKTNLKFDIYYTDNLGERRTVNMELPLSLVSTSANSTMAFSGGTFSGPRMRTNTTSFFSTWYFKLAVGIIIVIIGGVVYKKKKEKIKEYFEKKKKKKADSKHDIPVWVKSVKDKEKKN